MRTRSRTVETRVQPQVAGFSITNGAATYYCNGSPTVYANATYATMPAIVLEGFSERIQDSLGKTKSNPVIHRRRSFKVNDNYAAHGGWFNNTSYGIWPGSPMSWSQLPGRKSRLEAQVFNVSSNTLLPSRWTVSGSVNESVLKENCFEKARGLKADAMLNIVEANQVWPSIASLATTLPNIGLHWGKIRKLVKTASGGYLAWKFGVSPILQDVMAIERYLPKLGKDIAAMRSEKTHRFSSVGEYSIVCNEIPDITVANGRNVDVVRYQGRCIKAPTVRYVLVVKPSVKYHSEFFSALDTCMRRFSTSPATLAWELVPFSFIADWFVDLRGLARTVDAMLGVKPFDIINFSRSYSYSLGTDVSWGRYTPCDGSTIFENPCGSVDFSHYERNSASTGPSAPTWNPRFGKNQAAITAALIAQALSKIRH